MQKKCYEKYAQLSMSNSMPNLVFNILALYYFLL